MDKYNRSEAIAAQREFCTKGGLPYFAPHDGVCWKCNQNIYDEVFHCRGDSGYTTGITVEKASSELVTGCPHCNRSYCD